MNDIEMREVATIPVCFWCGIKKNEITRIMIPKDSISPRVTLVDYIACDTCDKTMSTGIAVVEVSENPYMGQPPIQEGQYPTGKWAVVAPSFFDKLLDNTEILKAIKNSKKMLLQVNDFKNLGLDSNSGNIN